MSPDHVALSLLGIFAGLVVVGGLTGGVRFPPFVPLLPSHIVGALSLLVLPIAVAALHWKHLAFAMTPLLALVLFAALGRAAVFVCIGAQPEFGLRRPLTDWSSAAKSGLCRPTASATVAHRVVR